MEIKNIEQKLEFYKNILKEKAEAYVMCNNGNNKTPLYIRKSDAAESGYFELNCTLFAYTFTRGNLSEEKFMREQDYVVIDNLAYDIQTPFAFFDFDKYMGSFEEITKKECVLFLRENNK